MASPDVKTAFDDPLWCLKFSLTGAHGHVVTVFSGDEGREGFHTLREIVNGVSLFKGTSGKIRAVECREEMEKQKGWVSCSDSKEMTNTFSMVCVMLVTTKSN